MKGFSEKGHGAKLGRKMESAIAALLSQPTLAAAAAECKISESTLRRWLEMPVFAERYRAARSYILQAATNLLRQSASTAVLVLRNVAVDRKASASARVSAAGRLLENAFKAVEVEDIQARLLRIEAERSGVNSDEQY